MSWGGGRSRESCVLYYLIYTKYHIRKPAASTPDGFCGSPAFPTRILSQHTARIPVRQAPLKPLYEACAWTAWALFRRKGFERGRHQLSSVWWLGRQTTAVSEYVERRALVGINPFLPQNPKATETTSCISFLKALPISQVLSKSSYYPTRHFYMEKAD